ncbi:8-amino-7-oxononanoate synthase [Fodinibius salinus]|uniref:8-amino-7-oxononanoate synthase n=1 Tax=Fodinibius salinus TaxID=860790 RepID=A0A5D3YMK9_9BACT|nr:8-amino-7-oxononanoate synthase [Fodinibius salinus]TYP95114.1 8-amino-7-oxononanoate synthase [Fodinibius salinus]
MSTTPKDHFIDEALRKRKDQHRFRELTSYQPKGTTEVLDDREELVNFSGNDYLGLSKHPKVINRAQDFTEQYGSGATASRLISGTYTIHNKLEQKIAHTFGWEAALVFNSGFQANSTIISTLANRHSLILADKLSHNSLLNGSLSSRASFRRFAHNDTADLESQLSRAVDKDYDRIIVITESLFSMDGDRSDLEAIAKLCKKYDAWLFVDDAHAVGVWGTNGLGLTHGVSGIDLVLGTCGKAFGAFGAFLLCSSKMRDYLINFCDGFIYTTALPPAVIGAVEAGLDLIPDLSERRNRLYTNIKRMKKGIRRAGFQVGNTESQIIPIMVGGEEQTLELATALEDAGFLATAIRPPTVPKGSARIRITLSSAHTKEQIDQFLTTLDQLNNE